VHVERHEVCERFNQPLDPVGDSDPGLEHCEAAKHAGAAIVIAPETYPFGERQYTARDFAGHVWTFTQTVANVEPGVWGGEMVEKVCEDRPYF